MQGFVYTDITQTRDLLDDEAELPSRRQIKELREKIGVTQETLFNLLSDLHSSYKERGDALQAGKVSEEMENIEKSFTNIQDRAQEYLNSRTDAISSIAPDWDEQTALKELDLDTNTQFKFQSSTETADSHAQPPIMGELKTQPQYIEPNGCVY